ncbi:MAG: tetratricopeptide repeat protein [Elusimicrobiota bacterium]
MKKNKEKRPVIWYYFSILSGLLLAPVSIIMQKPALFFLFHLAAVLSLYKSFMETRKERKHPFFDLQGIIIFAGLPVAGFLGYLAAKAVFIRKKEGYRATALKEYDEYLSEKNRAVLSVRKEKDIVSRIRRETDFDSFVDILGGSDRDMKARVISKLSGTLQPFNVELLRKAQNDESHEIRLYASSALLKLEESAEKRIETAFLNAAMTGSIDSYNELGLAYMDYIDSGLLSEGLKKDCYDTAAAAFRNSLDLDSGQKRVLLKYIQCLLKTEETGKAEKTLVSALKVWPGDPGFSFFLAELFFIHKKYGYIRDTLLGLEEKEMSDIQKEVCNTWIQ